MSNFAAPFGEGPVVDNEDALIDRIIKANEKMMKSGDGTLDRAQHPKGHGLVEGQFTIRDDIPEAFRVGLFAQSKTFGAQVRFSNGGSYDDSKPDAHGMAIKVLGVEGDKLLPDMAADQAADFVLVDNETFFEGDLEDYTEFNEFVDEIFGLVRNRNDVLEGVAKLIFVKTKNMLHAKLGIGQSNAVSEFTDQDPIPPHTGTYWSATPYQLGPDMAVKYEVRPESAAQKVVITDNADGISDALQGSLASGPARFVFSVLVQPAWNTHPADDPTIPWAPVAQRVPLATLEIAQMSAEAFEASKAAARASRFNPWNTLPAHRPLGAINRARKRVYQTLAARRSA